MKKVVLTIMDDVCLANGKDVNATQLLNVAKTYGKVTDFDDEVAALKAEYQKTLDNVVAQNKAIEAQNLTEEEIEIVNSYRTQRAKAVQTYIEENKKLNQTLEEIKVEHEKTIEIIASAINKK